MHDARPAIARGISELATVGPTGQGEDILSTFPKVRDYDEKAHGEYRTKRVILEVYDAMAEAARTGVPYVTRLDPPPADPRVTHPPRPAAPEPS